MNYLISIIITLILLINPFNALAEDIILAGGCFWCLEHDLESIKGINSVTSGYSGGELQNPNYENHNGHQEVILVNYNSQTIDLKEILRIYFRNIDPLDGKGQFCDRGDSYKPVMFYKNIVEKNIFKDALNSASKELNVSVNKIKVQSKERNEFWIAEDYHQDFARNNELKYKFYRFSCGRDQRLNQLWGENARSSSTWIK